MFSHPDCAKGGIQNYLDLEEKIELHRLGSLLWGGAGRTFLRCPHTLDHRRNPLHRRISLDQIHNVRHLDRACLLLLELPGIVAAAAAVAVALSGFFITAAISSRRLHEEIVC